MPIFQAYNPRISAWVKYDFARGVGFQVIDVKQKEPEKPFKKIKKKGNLK